MLDSVADATRVARRGPTAGCKRVLKLPPIIRAGLFLSCLAVAQACSFAPNFPPSDAGKVDSGLPVIPDGGQRVDAGLSPADACGVLNLQRCNYLARCGLIEASATLECQRFFEVTWCGPMTWPSHVAAGALKYEPARAEACGQAFLTRACGEWQTLPDSCTRFLLPRVPLGEDCYDGFAECTDGVCRGSSCPRTCQPRALLDDPCSADGDCRSGLYCKRSPFQPGSGQCAPFGTNGTACDIDAHCQEGLQCLAQQCRVLPPPGSSCVGGQCAETGFCEGGDAGVCFARKQQGATCTEGQCQTSLVCDPIRAVCVRVRLSTGELCSLAQECPSGEVCLGASSQRAGTCSAPQLEGERCDLHRDCEAHLACREADGGRTCERRAEAGARCDSVRVCQAGSLCSRSTCTALPLPGESCAATRACRWGLCRDLANTDGGAVCGPLLSAAQPCNKGEDCASGSCVSGTCVARCVP